MKHILYDIGVLPSPHKKRFFYNHLSFSLGRTVVRWGPAHGSPALHMLCFRTLKLRLSQTISKHDKTVSAAPPHKRKTHSMSKLQVYFKHATIFFTHKPSNIWTKGQSILRSEEMSTVLCFPMFLCYTIFTHYHVKHLSCLWPWPHTILVPILPTKPVSWPTSQA